MTANTWVARLQERDKAERSIILEYLENLDQAGPPPTVKYIKERLMEYDKRMTRRAAEPARPPVR